jgi:hypothetical protein
MISLFLNLTPIQVHLCQVNMHMYWSDIAKKSQIQSCTFLKRLFFVLSGDPATRCFHYTFVSQSDWKMILFNYFIN